MTETSSFEELSRQVALGFLQSVVVVDDLACLCEADEAHPHSLATPGRENIGVKTVVKAGQDTVDEPSHELQAKLLIDGFADRGLVCSVLRPKYKEDFEKRTASIAQRADILVLDWKIQGESGEDVHEFVSTLLSNANDQIQLMAIYTADRLVTVREKLAQVVGSKGKFIEEDDGYTLIQGATRICILAKEGSIGAPPKQIVTVQQLPDRLIDEFTKATMGLLSNVALKSLAAIRSNTRHILNRFRRGLDAPYLTHRMLLPIPQDAEEFLAFLVGEELQAILEESGVSEAVSLEAIRSWLEWKKPKVGTYSFNNGGNLQAWSIDQITALLEQGIKNVDEEMLNSCGLSKNKADNAHEIPLTSVFDSSSSLDEEFAQLTVLRSIYCDRPRLLTLGTLVKTGGSNPSYLVCIQPRCDCVRLNEARAFLFLPLSTVTGKGKFDLILRCPPDQYLSLKIDRKPYNSQMIFFLPTDKTISATKDGAHYWFTDKEGNKYKWIGELRLDHGLRLSNEFATGLSRIGIDESEWLRLRKPKSL